MAPVIAQSQVTPTLSSQEQYFLNEIKDAYGGIYQMSYNYPRAYHIYQQLMGYSGMNYYVTFAQTFNAGQAHYGGLIILDYSTINKRQEILAFIFAHEWAHQALGHQANIYFPNGSRAARMQAIPSANEDAADAYAGRFLSRYGYNLSVVTNFLKNLPDGDDHTHSSGADRADIVEAAYYNRNGTASRSRSSSTRERCSTCDGKGYEIEEVNCPYCKGEGSVYCSTCKGQGTYVSQGFNAYGQYGYWRYTCPTCGGARVLDCRACKGDGTVRKKVKCIDCNGTGYELE